MSLIPAVRALLGSIFPGHASLPASTCFVCGAAHPGDTEQTIARAACGRCHARVRLVVGGALLTDLLNSVRPYPLEGNGLNAVLNPVVIDGRRGWALFAAGTFLVREEVRPSADYFDFCVQHVWPGPGILLAVKAAGLGPDTEMRRLVGVVTDVPSRHPAVDAVTWLTSAWVPLEAQATVADHAPILTNEQAWAATEARMAAGRSWTPADERSLVSRVVGLAERFEPNAAG